MPLNWVRHRIGNETANAADGYGDVNDDDERMNGWTDENDTDYEEQRNGDADDGDNDEDDMQLTIINNFAAIGAV